MGEGAAGPRCESGHLGRSFTGALNVCSESMFPCCVKHEAEGASSPTFPKDQVIPSFPGDAFRSYQALSTKSERERDSLSNSHPTLLCHEESLLCANMFLCVWNTG